MLGGCGLLAIRNGKFTLKRSFATMRPGESYISLWSWKLIRVSLQLSREQTGMIVLDLVDPRLCTVISLTT